MNSDSPGRCPVFRAAPRLPGRHLQTILPARWPAPAVPGSAEPRVVDVADRSAVRLEISRPGEPIRGTLLLIHGMGGSAGSTYMRRTAVQALRRGWTTARMNLRNCGGTETLSTTLYTAPDAGFESAEAYYAAASAAPWLSSLNRPGLILSAANDPFVPVEMFARHRGLETIRFLHPEQGGHCGYWQRGAPRYWAGETMLDFFEQACR